MLSQFLLLTLHLALSNPKLTEHVTDIFCVTTRLGFDLSLCLDTISKDIFEKVYNAINNDLIHF